MLKLTDEKRFCAAATGDTTTGCKVMLVRLFGSRCRFRMLRFGIFCFGGSRQASRLSLGELDRFPSDRRGVVGAGRPVFLWGGGVVLFFGPARMHTDPSRGFPTQLGPKPRGRRQQHAPATAGARPAAADPSASPPASCRTAVQALRQQRGRAAPHAVRPAACRPHAASGRGVAAPWKSPGPSGNALQSGLLAGRA